jgi:hypothetical protein
MSLLTPEAGLKPLTMRVDMVGTLVSASDCIKRITRALCEDRGLSFNEAEAEASKPEGMSEDEYEQRSGFQYESQPAYYAHALREMCLHVLGMRAGVHAKAEFEKFYCLDQQFPVCEYFRLLRGERGLTPAAIESRVAVPGLTAEQIRQWEQALLELPEETVEKLLQAVQASGETL